MINTNALKGIIAQRGLSQREVAKRLGMTDKTFYTKMGKGIFCSDEMDGMIAILDIKNPAEIFFTTRVTRQVTTD